MDLKRFGLFLILSWAILMGSQMFFAPPQQKNSPDGTAAVPSSADGTTPANGVGATGVLPGVPGDANPGGPGEILPAGGVPESGSAMQAPMAEPWSETLTVGAAGEVGRYQVRFDSLGAVIAEMRTADYFTTGDPDIDREDPTLWMPLVKHVETKQGWAGSMSLRAGPSALTLIPYALDRIHWDHEILKESGTVVGVRFFHRVEATGLTIEKTMKVVLGKHEWDIQIALVGGAGTLPGKKARFILTPAMGMIRASSDSFYEEPKARACGESGGELESDYKLIRADSEELSDTFGVGNSIVYGGMDNKYFAMLLRPQEGSVGALGKAGLVDASWRRTTDVNWEEQNPGKEPTGAYHHVVTDLGLNLSVPAEAARFEWNYRLYAGPKERSEFESTHAAHAALVSEDLGFFDGIANFLLRVLGFFHSLVGNWGVAIIMLTLTVRLALFPFNRRSQTAMAKHATKMKRVQPKLTANKEKHKNDPKKLREGQAKIMQEESAFPPLGGCLPPLVQIPIFFGLFSALRVAFDLRQERFLWIEDLSMPDRLAHLGINTHLPIIGVIDWLNILPILMVILWVAQQKVMPKPTDPQQQQMQKMMMWMPVVFGVFLYNYSAGLSLYMVTSSAFGILEYTVVRRIWPLDETEAPKKKGRLAQRMETMMKEAQKMQEAKNKSQRKGTGGGKKRS